MTAAVALLGLCGSAFAGLAAPTGWDMVINFNGGTWRASNNPSTWTIGPVEKNGKTVWQVDGFFQSAHWSCDWTLELDPDPFVFQNILMTNLTAAPATFSVTTTLPVFPTFPGPNTMDGSISGSIINQNNAPDVFGNGATVKSFGALPFFEGIVDNVLVPTAQLRTAPQLHTVPGFGTNAIPMESFAGLPAPANLVNIGIRNNFELGNGDSVNFFSTFQIVPTPGGLALVVVGGIAAVRRRRA